MAEYHEQIGSFAGVGNDDAVQLIKRLDAGGDGHLCGSVMEVFRIRNHGSWNHANWSDAVGGICPTTDPVRNQTTGWSTCVDSCVIETG
jgi:hypothetical protein